MDMDQFEWHTPGPWAAHGSNVVAADGSVVADVAGGRWWRGTRPLFAANARLMAAAPELLAEVRRLTAEADALRRERDELAARLAEIVAQKPVAFFRLSDAEWLAIGRPAIVYKTADGDWREPLYSCPTPAAAPERAEPADPQTPPPGCRLLALARPCRCSQDGCSDSTSCPRGER